MVSDKERYENLKKCHVYLAIKRKKENEESSKKIHRQIVYNSEIDLNVIKAKCKTDPGVWRIYRTVNKRNMNKALKNFRHIIIDTEKTSIESLWRKELLQPENKATKLFMIDLDNKADYGEVNYWLSGMNIKIHNVVSSVNGQHIITDKFNRMAFKVEFPDIDVLIDGYVFIELYNCN